MKYYYQLKFGPAVDVVVKKEATNPKRVQREAEKQRQLSPHAFHLSPDGGWYDTGNVSPCGRKTADLYAGRYSQLRSACMVPPSLSERWQVQFPCLPLTMF